MDHDTPLSEPPSFPFTRLPFELRCLVLQYTDLVIPYLPPPPSEDLDDMTHKYLWNPTYATPYVTQGLHVRHGKLSVSRTLRCCRACFETKHPDGCGSDEVKYIGRGPEETDDIEYEPDAADYTGCIPSAREHIYFQYKFLTALLYVSHDVAKLARDVLFSCNRLVLSGDPARNLAFLKMQRPNTLNAIRRLEFSFSLADFNFVRTERDPYEHAIGSDPLYTGPNRHPQGHEAYFNLVSWTADHLRLENLDVSVNPSGARHELEHSELGHGFRMRRREGWPGCRMHQFMRLWSYPSLRIPHGGQSKASTFAYQCGSTLNSIWKRELKG